MSQIELKKVGYRAGEKILLQNIDFTLMESENWVLFGRNGSGKSLLLQIITGYLRASEGEVIRFGDMHSDVRELHKQIGYIGTAVRHNMHPNEKVIEAVISGKFGSIGIYDRYENQDSKTAMDLLQITGTAHLENRLYSHLSDGEKERVLIARALMNEPKILILDEPCSNLDIRGREDFLVALSDVKASRSSLSILFVTHHIEEITPIFEKILILKDGRILEKGKTKDLLNEGILSEALGIQVSIFEKNGRFYSYI